MCISSNSTVAKEVEFLIFVDVRSPKPLYEQIKESIRTQMTYGLLAPDERLPSVREFAKNAAINPNTIQKAYRDLEAEGLIYSVPGRGSFVASISEEQKQKRKNEILGTLKPLVQELKFNGMSEDELCGWLKGGMKNDD